MYFQNINSIGDMLILKSLDDSSGLMYDQLSSTCQILISRFDKSVASTNNSWPADWVDSQPRPEESFGDICHLTLMQSIAMLVLDCFSK